MDKATLRKKLKTGRSLLTAEECRGLSRRIVNQTWEILDWDKIHSVHCYLPIAANNEVNIAPLLHAAKQAKPDIKVATTTNPELETYWLDDELKPTKKVSDGFRFGLIIVPMLGFDEAGYRLGYGGGFYDRFLAGQDQALIIGVCYELGRLAKMPHEGFDIPMQVIVTEKAIYKF